MKIRSYDIFDTCLIRSCGNPDQIFHILALEILGKNASKNKLTDFALMRSIAEKVAKRNLNKSDVTIKEIYNQCDFSLFTEINKDNILQKELDIEYRSLLGVKAVRERISKDRENGYHIVYISDMYLPANFIEAVLAKEGFWDEEDELYVSCEYGKSKRKGDLFKEIKDLHGNDIETWTHHGDNVESDIRIPRKLGIRSIYIDHAYTPYQKKLLDNPQSYNDLISYRTAGISRAVINNVGKDAECLIAADLIAPVFVPFVYNVLSEARDRSIKALYFLARDGQILYSIAKGFKNLFPEITLHYLCVSRKTIYFPSLKSYEEIKDIIDFKKTIHQDPIDIIYNYTGVRINLPENSKHKSLQEILEIRSVRQILENAHDESKKLILRYFVQEGIATCNDSPKAIVDLRGTTKSLAYINDLLTGNGYDSVYGFYFEVTKNRISTSRSMEYYSELSDENYNYSDKRLGSLYSILESYFCASNHGRTIGYKAIGSKIVPVLEKESNQKDITKIYDINNTIVRLWQTHYIFNYIFSYNNEALKLGLSNLKSFAIYPSSDYLRPLTLITFSSTGIERECIVRKLSFKEILSMKLKETSLSWFQGCVTWTFGNSFKYIISAAKNIKKSVKNIKTRYTLS